MLFHALEKKITDILLEDDVYLFHASTLMVNGCGIAITAQSVTGKSMHARLWRENEHPGEGRPDGHPYDRQNRVIKRKQIEGSQVMISVDHSIFSGIVLHAPDAPEGKGFQRVDKIHQLGHCKSI